MGLANPTNPGPGKNVFFKGLAGCVLQKSWRGPPARHVYCSSWRLLSWLSQDAAERREQSLLDIFILLKGRCWRSPIPSRWPREPQWQEPVLLARTQGWQGQEKRSWGAKKMGVWCQPCGDLRPRGFHPYFPPPKQLLRGSAPALSQQWASPQRRRVLASPHCKALTAQLLE